ncbi:MAG TPA: sigma-70 family RNA polymerase sigma factor [Micromonosporaceae bacterium]|nr:sigma-70 family RNA polymerase sigma factor [Micromonosporaceae bacterium]
MADEPYPGLREFLAARGRLLSRGAYLLTGDHHLAEDLVQSAVMRVLRYWKKTRVDGPEVYVRLAMYHRYLSRRRYRRISKVVTGQVHEPMRVDQHETSPSRISLDAALAALSPRQRAVLVLRYYESLAEADTAVVFNCSVGTVQRYVHEGLARLRLVAPHLLDSGHIVEGMDG